MQHLWGLKRGQSSLIKGFSAELDKNYVMRLMDLGFHPGERILCVQAPALGAPKLYQINNAVYSLDDQVAALVEIDSLDSIDEGA